MFNSTRLTILFALLVFAQTALAQKTGRKELDTDLKAVRKSGSSFNWEAVDASKKGSVTIDSVHLTGTWKAYNGLFIFQGNVNSMNLFKPFVLQIKNLTISRSEESNFFPLTISNNKLLIKEDNGTDEGFVNLLTDKLLVITWKSASGYTRYYYELSE
jgi:hypothetical protein